MSQHDEASTWTPPTRAEYEMAWEKLLRDLTRVGRALGYRVEVDTAGIERIVRPDGTLAGVIRRLRS